MSKKRLPELEEMTASAWQLARLARWLQEWQLAGSLQDCYEETETSSVYTQAAGRDISADVDLPPETGHVRLLYPHDRAAWHVPIFVALLRKVGASAFLVAPFSRFAEPATPSELATGRSAAPLRVLCLWNARDVPRNVIDPSWYVDTLSAEEIEHALAIYDCAEDGGAPPTELVQHIGPPLIHPEDPRRTYVRRERLRLDCVLREQEAVYPLPDVTDLPLAAEDRNSYGEDSEDPNPDS